MVKQHPGSGDAPGSQPSGAAHSATVGRTGRAPVDLRHNQASPGEDADFGDAGPLVGETSSIFDTLDMLCEESANTNWTIELLRQDTDRLRQESAKINSQLERLGAAVKSLKAGMSKIEQLAGAVDGVLARGLPDLSQELRRGIETAVTDLSTALHHSDRENANHTLELLNEFRATTRRLESLATARPERGAPGPTR